MSGDIALGNIGLSVEMHGYLSNLVNGDESNLDNPFESIMQAFRFAFALGYHNGKTKKIEGKAKDVSARGFVAKDYEFLIGDECKQKGKSLGGLINEYAEAGCHIMSEHQTAGGLILDLLSVEP
mgnify:CR=1 FL=1